MTKGPRAPRDSGFSLIELSIIVLVVAILLAIAVATYLGVISRAGSTATEATTKQAVLAQEAYYGDAQEYASAGVIRAFEPGVRFETFSSGGALVLGTVYVKDPSGAAVELVVRDRSGDCYWTRQANGFTSYAKGGCTAPPPATDFAPQWP